MIENATNKHNINLIPDAYFSLILSKDADKDFEVILEGLSITFEENKEIPVTKMFGISFKLHAYEYIFGKSISNIKNAAKKSP